MSTAIRDWPIEFADAPVATDGDVQVSFILGHRGMERVPQLLATLATLAAQRDVRIECVVVEQSARIEVRDLLPGWVRYVHTPLPAPALPYCRSWALNVGARVADGKVLIFHDNDMLVPRAYAAQVWQRCQEGYEVVNLKRFIFYLGEQYSQELQSRHQFSQDGTPEVVVQNLEAGGSVATTRDAFVALGGYDETFVGWGGEDNEFWERAQTRRVWPYTCLPIVHLWHAAQPGKVQPKAPTVDHYRLRSALPAAQRIAELQARDFGNAAQMNPAWSADSRA